MANAQNYSVTNIDFQNGDQYFKNMEIGRFVTKFKVNLSTIPEENWNWWKRRNPEHEISNEQDSNGYHTITWHHAKHQVPITGVVIEFHDIDCGEDIAIIEYEPTPPPQ